MYTAEIKLLTHDFSPATGGSFNDPLVNTPAAPAVTVDPTGPVVTGVTKYTNTVTELFDAAGTSPGDVFIVTCIAYTDRGQRLKDNIQITIRPSEEV
jgi:hypothetical protein